MTEHPTTPPINDIADAGRVRALLAEAEARAETLRTVLAVLEGRPAVPAGSGLRPLTRRQREVAELVGKSMPNADIATELGLSEHTVRVHVSAILKTLGLANRTALALWWREHAREVEMGASGEAGRAASPSHSTAAGGGQ